jgi:uncharacterized protein
VLRRVLAHAMLVGLLALSVLAAPPARAQSKLTIPPPTGVVNDFARVLDAATVERITRIAEDVRNKSRGEIAVVTLSDIGQYAATDVALQIGREWKVGKIGNPGDPTRNAGAVILLVPKETNSDGRGRCFIATGQGAEGFITDATAGDICREATPAFQQRDYATGLELVTLRAAQRFANEFKFSLDTGLVPPAPVQYREPESRGIPPFVFLIIFFVVMSILSSASRRAQRRGRKGRDDGCNGCFWPLLVAMQSSGGHRGGWSGGGFGGGGGGSSW